MSLAKVDCESCTIVSFDMSSMGLEAIAHECVRYIFICVAGLVTFIENGLVDWTNPNSPHNRIGKPRTIYSYIN